MCVIAVIPKGVKLPSFHVLHQMWQSNPDGAGFMYPATTRDGKPILRVIKGLMTFTALKHALQRHRADMATTDHQTALVDIALHFRISSAGGVVPMLTHPFLCGSDIGLMHNGHISSLAYDHSTGTKLAGASVAPSKKRSRAISTFKDESQVEALKIILDRIVKRGMMSDLNARAYLAKYKPGVHGSALSAGRRLVRAALGAPLNKETEDIIIESVLEEPFEAVGSISTPSPTPEPVVPPAIVNPESDTSRLASILTRLPKGWQRNDVVAYMLEEAFLKSDRVVLFDSDGLAKIVGEKRGDWVDGMWVSNSYWKSGRFVSGKDLSTSKSTTFPHTDFADYTPPTSMPGGSKIRDVSIYNWQKNAQAAAAASDQAFNDWENGLPPDLDDDEQGSLATN